MKKLFLTSVVAIMLQTQAYCQLKNYSNNSSIKIISEKTTLKITDVDTRLEPVYQSAALIASASAILPPVIDLVVKSVKEKAKKNALAYKGEYKCFASGERFYKNSKTAALPNLTMTRIIKTQDRNNKIAVEIQLIPELSEDKIAFRYYIKDTLLYNFSIAKTKGIYDYIDIKLEINFKSIFIKSNEYKIEDLRTTSILIPMIHVGSQNLITEKYVSGWIPLPPRSDNNNSQSEITDVKKDNNTGLYEIVINATETNPYKIKAENEQEIIESSSESVTTILNAIFEVLLKDKN